MYQSLSITQEGGDDAAVGMDVFSTLFVIFVLITAVGTILMGGVNIPNHASYIRVFVQSEIGQELPLCIGEAIPCNSLKNSSGDVSALYVQKEQGEYMINVYVEDVISLKRIVDIDSSATIDISIFHPLISKENADLITYSIGELYEKHRANPDSPIISLSRELNYEGL